MFELIPPRGPTTHGLDAMICCMLSSSSTDDLFHVQAVRIDHARQTHIIGTGRREGGTCRGLYFLK